MVKTYYFSKKEYENELDDQIELNKIISEKYKDKEQPDVVESINSLDDLLDKPLKLQEAIMKILNQFLYKKDADRVFDYLKENNDLELYIKSANQFKQFIGDPVIYDYASFVKNWPEFKLKSKSVLPTSSEKEDTRIELRSAINGLFVGELTKEELNNFAETVIRAHKIDSEEYEKIMDEFKDRLEIEMITEIGKEEEFERDFEWLKKKFELFKTLIEQQKMAEELKARVVAERISDIFERRYEYLQKRKKELQELQETKKERREELKREKEEREERENKDVNIKQIQSFLRSKLAEKKVEDLQKKYDIKQSEAKELVSDVISDVISDVFSKIENKDVNIKQIQSFLRSKLAEKKVEDLQKKYKITKNEAEKIISDTISEISEIPSTSETIITMPTSITSTILPEKTKLKELNTGDLGYAAVTIKNLIKVLEDKTYKDRSVLNEKKEEGKKLLFNYYEFTNDKEAQDYIQSLTKKDEIMSELNILYTKLSKEQQERISGKGFKKGYIPDLERRKQIIQGSIGAGNNNPILKERLKILKSRRNK